MALLRAISSAFKEGRMNSGGYIGIIVGIVAFIVLKTSEDLPLVI